LELKWNYTLLRWRPLVKSKTRAIIEGVVQVPLGAMPFTTTTFVEKTFINVIVVAQEVAIKVKMIVTIGDFRNKYSLTIMKT
jgi:hypothetical protein